jgi:hypothetical protein
VIPLAVRLASAFFLLLAATHNLLSSIPFAYYMFIESPPFWWMPVLAKLEPLVVVAGLWGLSGLEKPSRLLEGSARPLTVATLTAAACMAVPIVVPAVASFALSGVLCFVPIGVLIWSSILEAQRRSSRAAGLAPPQPPPIATAALAALLAATMFAVNALLSGQRARSLAPAEIALGAAIALACQVVLFIAADLIVSTARRVATDRAWTPALRELATGAAASAVLALLLERCVISSLMLEEWRAVAVSAAYAAALVAFAWTLPMPKSGRHRAAVAAVIIAAAVFVVPPLLQFADWAFSVQKLLALAAWGAAFALTAAIASRPASRRLLAASTAVVWIASVSTLAVRSLGRNASEKPVEPGLAIDRYATLDTSLRALLDVGRPVVSDRAFLTTLRDVGDITYNRSLPPVPLVLADPIAIDRARVPHLFIVIIDSLRPDYVSAYNPRVSFTPAIDAFARDSIVLRHAYTAYSGTSLSEAGLWAGGLVQRAMYVKPWAPMNNLERLTVAAGYRRYISVDEVLDRILSDWNSGGGVVRLDTAVLREGRESDYYRLDLCSTVDEFLGRLDADKPAGPVFLFTQPKNLHIRVIAGETPNYATLRGADEFFRPAANTIRRLDGCFGRLIDALKAKRMYDDSIIVLSADHGDAYGEDGRWGHAFYVTPETLRIPLIVHVPDRMRPHDGFDADRVAWLTDVTPTLYSLLGNPPRPVDDLTGRPLFEPMPYRSSNLRLVQSSYSRIFGLMDPDAHWMYTADANRLTEEFFDLTSTPPSQSRIGEADRMQYHRWLLDALGRLNAFYAR